MKILIANLGSTSFKYRLLDMADERQLAHGGVERIGDEASRCYVQIGGATRERTSPVADHAVAVRLCLEQLTEKEIGCLSDVGEIAAIGLKAVHGGRVSGVQRVTTDLLDAMEEMARVAPAHNPPYTAAMRLLGEQLPEIPLVAAFETGFHETIEPRNRCYAIPHAWSEEYGVRRYGFHGASHRYLAERMAQFMGRDDLRVISCHLGGSSSLCASRGGKSVATTMGMSPQSGLPQNNRVGDFDPFALPLLIERTGKTLEGVLDELANQSGLLGISGVSGDLRDIQAAAEAGNSRAQLALDVYVTSVRHYLGAYLVELGGADAIVFSGGIGENRVGVRQSVCADLSALGIVLDEEANRSAEGAARIDAAESKTEIWVVPTNEEIVVARQVKALLEG